MIKFMLFPILLYSPWFSWLEHLLGLPVEYNQLVRFYILDLLMHIVYIHYSNFIDLILTHSFVWIHTWRCHDVNAKIRGQLREPLLSFYNLGSRKWSLNQHDLASCSLLRFYWSSFSLCLEDCFVLLAFSLAIFLSYWTYWGLDCSLSFILMASYCTSEPF